MADIVTEAKDLIKAANDRGKCLHEAKAVQDKLDDLKAAAGAANSQIYTGVTCVAGAAVIAIVSWWTGVGIPAAMGLAAGGVAAIAGGLGAKKDAMSKAIRDLKRAIDDLRECLATTH